MWAYDSGAGWFGGFIVGTIAAALTYGIGQLLLAFVRPLWLRIAIALAFVVRAALAGYHAIHGIVQHTMPLETWQIAFSVIGSVAVGVPSLLKTLQLAPSELGRPHRREKRWTYG